METATISDNVKVAVRVRQLIQKELTGGLKSHWRVSNDTICCDEVDSAGRKITPYQFDRVFDETTITMDIFEDVCKPIVDSAIAGFNGTIFAYGQSSSGKTFTMLGSKVQSGIVTLAINEIWSAIDNIPDREFLIRVGYLEIYNERVSDLLSPNESILKLQEDTDHNIQVVGLTEEMVNDVSGVMKVLQKGNAKRHTAETKQNDRSSRSHCILRIVIESRQVGHEDDAVNVSNLNFVDLAGSEKAGDNSGDRFREGCAINKSLFTLGMVIRKLTGDTSQQHVSFRDSKLTRILKNALGGNSKTAIICTITPAHIDESDSTLKFASRAKNICNKPKVNEVMSEEAMLRKYRSQIKKLEMQIKEMNDTDMKMEKAELERRLQEKEAAEKEQADMISKLRTMIVTAGPAVIQEPPKKKRRETWCPGKAMRDLAVIPEFSPPRMHKKPSLEANLTVFDEEPPPMVADMTIEQNPYTKELFELQDKHELLLEELKKKDAELKELQDFTTLERECESDTIKDLNEKIKALESNLPWLEEELLKTQQERNNFRQKLEAMNRKLTSVEDGTGMTAKSKELTESKSINVELNSELDIQKSMYEFHIEQMKKKLETYTLILEEKGVGPDYLKQRLSADNADSSISSSVATSKQKEIDELRNEIDMLVIGSEKAKQKMEEMNAQFEAEFEDQKARFQKDLEEARDEIEIYQQLLQEEKAKYDCAFVGSNISEVKAELEEQTERYEIQETEMKHQVEVLTYKRNEAKIDAEENEDVNHFILKHDTSMMAQSDGDTPTDVPQITKKKGRKHVNFNIGSEVEIQKEIFDQKLHDLINERDDVIAALEQSKTNHEDEMIAMQANVDKYVELYEEEKQKLEQELQSRSKQTENQDFETTEAMLSECSESEKSQSSEMPSTEGHAEIEKLKLQVTELEEKHALKVEQMKEEFKELEENHALKIEQMKEEFAKFVEDNFLNAENSTKSSQNGDENINHAKQESETDKELYEEYKANVPDSEKSKISDVRTEMLVAEIDALKMKHCEALEKIEELSSYKTLLEQEKATQSSNRPVHEDTVERDTSSDLKSELSVDEMNCNTEESLKVMEAVEEKSSDLKNEMLIVELKEQKDKFFKEVEEKENELSSYKLLLDQERAKTEENATESLIRFELLTAEMNEQKDKHAKELEALADELSSYKLLFEQEKAKQSESLGDSDLRYEMLIAEINELKEKHSKELKEMEEELSSCKMVLDEERAKLMEGSTAENSDLKYERLVAEMNEQKETHAKELEAQTDELSSFKMLLEEERAKRSESLGDSDLRYEMLTAEINELKGKHSKELKEMEEELISCKIELEEERAKKAEGSADSDLRYDLLKAVLNEQKEKHCKQVETLEDDLHSYKLSLEEEIAKKSEKSCDPDAENFHKTIKDTEAKYEAEIAQLKTEIDMYQKTSSEEIEDTHNKTAEEELSALKEKHADEIETLKDEIAAYKELLDEMKMKSLENVSIHDKSGLKESTPERQANMRDASQQTAGGRTDGQEDLQCVIEDTQKDLHTMREQMQLLSKEIYNLQAANTKLKNEKLELINVKEQLQEKIDQLEEEIKDIKGDIKLQEEESSLLQSRISDLEEYIKLGEGMLADKNEEIETLKQSLEEQMAADEEVEKRTSELRDQCSGLEEKVAALEGELQLQTEKVVELEITESQFSSQVVNLESELEEAKGRENTLTKLCGEYEDKIVSLETDKELDTTKLQELQESYCDQNKELERLKLDLELAQNKDAELKDVQETYQGKMRKLEQELKEAQARATKLENLKTDLDENLVLLEKQLEQANTRVTDIEGLREELETANSRVKVLEEILEKGKIQLEQAQSRLGEMEVNRKEASETVKDLESRLEMAETEKEALKTEVDELTENTKGTREISEENAYLKERAEALQKDRLLSDELISEYDSEVQELKTRLAALKEDSSKVEEKVKQELEERICDLEAEKNILSAKHDSEKTETELRLKALEKERDDLKSELEVLKNDFDKRSGSIKEENAEAKEELETLRRERDSLQDDVIQLQRDKAPITVTVNPESDSEWEKKWTEFVKEEKLKRLDLIVKIRTLKSSLKYEQLQMETVKEDALKEVIRTGKDKEVIAELEERFRKADEDANRLHSDLEDERKVTEEQMEKIAKLENQLANKKGGFVSSADHNCDFRLENVRVKHELKEAKWELDKKVKSYEELIQNYNDRISKMKNEMRRMQTNMDSSVCTNSSSKTNNTTPSSTSYGSSAGGGIVDHFKVCYMEAENKRLQQELAQLKKKLAKTEALDKENRGLKQDLNGVKDELKKMQSSAPVQRKETITPREASASTTSCDTSLSNLPLSEMIQQACAPSPPRTTSEILEMARKAPTASNLGLLSSQKKKKTSSKEEADNCKTQ